MSTISRIKTWATAETLTAADLNAEFNNIVNDYNGSITNANIDASAAIDITKLSASVVSLTGTQTLTNKTLTSPTVTGTQADSSVATHSGKNTFSAGVISTPVALTPEAAATATCNLALGNDFEITMPAGNITIAISNATVGQKFLISILQDGTGSRTVTWFTTIKWAGESAPVLTTTASKRDWFGFKVISADNYDGVVIAQNI